MCLVVVVVVVCCCLPLELLLQLVAEDALLTDCEDVVVAKEKQPHNGYSCHGYKDGLLW